MYEGVETGGAVAYKVQEYYRVYVHAAVVYPRVEYAKEQAGRHRYQGAVGEFLHINKMQYREYHARHHSRVPYALLIPAVTFTYAPRYRTDEYGGLCDRRTHQREYAEGYDR